MELELELEFLPTNLEKKKDSEKYEIPRGKDPKTSRTTIQELYHI